MRPQERDERLLMGSGQGVSRDSRIWANISRRNQWNLLNLSLPHQPGRRCRERRELAEHGALGSPAFHGGWGGVRSRAEQSLCGVWGPANGNESSQCAE